MKKIIIPKKKLLSNTERRRTLKELFAKPEIKETLNTFNEKRYFKEEIGKFAKGGIQKGEIKEMLADMKYNSEGVINHKEANKLIHAFGFKPRHIQKGDVLNENSHEQKVLSHDVEHNKYADFKKKQYHFLDEGKADTLSTKSNMTKPPVSSSHSNSSLHLH